MPRYITIIYFLMVVWIQSSNALANDSVPVVFQGATHYAPFYYQQEDRYVGFDISLFRAIAKEAGFTARFHFDAWDKTQSALAAGKVDVVPMFVSEARKQQYIFTDPILIENHLLFGKRESPSHRNVSSLDGYTIAAENQAYSLAELQRRGVNANLLETRSETQALRRVANGQADYALVPMHVGYYAIEQHDFDHLVAVSPPLLPVAYAYAVNPQRPELVNKINNALIKLQRSGVRKDLQRKWLSPYVPRTWSVALAEYAWMAGIILIMAMLAIIGFKAYGRRYTNPVEGETIQAPSMEYREKMPGQPGSLNEVAKLPRRHTFLDMLSGVLDTADHDHLVIGIMTVSDLEYLHHIIGDEVVDDILDETTEHISQVFPDNVGIIGRGQFAFFLKEDVQRERVIDMVGGLLEKLNYDYTLSGEIISIRLTAGLVIYPDHAREPAELVRKARLALHHALSQRQHVYVYEPDIEPDVSDLKLMQDLKSAIANDKLSWVYQPQYSYGSQKISGAEMLIRWRHDQHGWISPDYFINLAEQTSMINLVTRQVIMQAKTVLKEWQARSRDWRLSINMSIHDLDDSSMVEFLIETLGEFHSALTIEITETAIMQDFEIITANIERIKKAGLRVALDDYGTGYSSLNYLKMFNIDEIKIDRTFINNIQSSERDYKLTQASISLAHELNALIVAEGVEDMSTATLLDKLGCDVLQGYGIAHPMSLPEFETFADSYRIS